LFDLNKESKSSFTEVNILCSDFKAEVLFGFLDIEIILSCKFLNISCKFLPLASDTNNCCL